MDKISQLYDKFIDIYNSRDYKNKKHFFFPEFYSNRNRRTIEKAVAKILKKLRHVPVQILRSWKQVYLDDSKLFQPRAMMFPGPFMRVAGEYMTQPIEYSNQYSKDIVRIQYCFNGLIDLFTMLKIFDIFEKNTNGIVLVFVGELHRHILFHLFTDKTYQTIQHNLPKVTFQRETTWSNHSDISFVLTLNLPTSCTTLTHRQKD